MQFTVRSLGGKLIIVATSTLLLCLLLFTLLSWGILKVYSEYQARKDAQTHLSTLQHTYQNHVQGRIQDITRLSQEPHIVALMNNNATDADKEYIHGFLTDFTLHEHLTTLDIVNHDQHIVMPDITIQPTQEEVQVINQALQGKSVLALQQGNSTQKEQQPQNFTWVMKIGVPLSMHTAQGGVAGVLVATEPLDDTFAQMLTQKSGANLVLCMDGHMLTSTVLDIKRQSGIERQVCSSGKTTIAAGGQEYLLETGTGKIVQQIKNSPALTIGTTELLYTLDPHNNRQLLIIISMGLFVFALGIIITTFITSVLLIRPLRRLQVHARKLVASNTGIELGLPRADELNMLANSFNLLSDSLYSESQALTEQMSNLLIMSDALISTLNLEQLLGEIVARMGKIMKVKHVSLLLYGHDLQTPTSVAQWTKPERHGTHPLKETVTVYADPDGDITQAATSKLRAIASPRVSSASGKRAALRATKLTSGTIEAVQANDKETLSAAPRAYTSRIPRSALRELDGILAQMAIQRQKIVYAEDIAIIYQQRQEQWAQLALESGYRSAISIPLLFREQAIGAFILYTDDVHRISSRDTFLLSTAAIQTSMAIQNALLFAEVKEKNTALERANQLKSQFLANVTHELRTPLHSIISYGALIVEGFVEGELTAEQEEHIQFMIRRAEDLSHLVDDMLDLSKIEADRIEVKPEPLELASCLQEVVNQLKPMANNKELYLNLEVEPGLPQALADSHRLRQVAINLVSNALKFTEHGGVTIRCQQIKARDMLCVSVADTGIGISPPALGYIFEAFRQADGSTTRRFGGTGLGLTIARKLIELQGGEIAVESLPGEGTTFSFTLPRVTG